MKHRIQEVVLSCKVSEGSSHISSFRGVLTRTVNSTSNYKESKNVSGHAAKETPHMFNTSMF